MTTEKIKSIMLDDKGMKADDICRRLSKRRKIEDYNPPEHISDKIEIQSVYENGGVCFYVKPKGVEVNKFFFYMHGGGHCMQINKRQWGFVMDMVEKTGYGAAVPIYPLAPEYSAEDTFDMLIGAYRKISQKETIERMVLVGDSTGGGLALSMAILAWKSGLRRPDKLVLISPAMDTEFMDRNMENSMRDRKKEFYRYYYRPTIKEFLRRYWIKDLAHQNEYTCPMYADLTDVCDEIAIFTVESDMLNCYARALYEEIKKLQMKAHYFEFFGIVHDYIEHPHVPECRMIMNKIAESIQDETKTVSTDIVHAVWARSMLAERYPKIYIDDDSIKLAARLNTSYKDINAQYSDYDRLVMLSRIVEMDKRVKQFINRYADGVIVNVGSELDTMFSRVDNGRIKWYNVDLPERMELRRKYMESRDREQNIDKSILDFTWLEQIKKKPGQAILFVCCDVTKYFTKKRLETFLDAVWKHFPGAEIVFDVKNSVGRNKWNLKVLLGKKKGSFIKVSMDNCTSLMYDWNIKYRVLYDKSILNSEDITDMFSADMVKRFKHAMTRKYDKIIQLRLGTERVIDNL
jgi:acetyl esterase/lipase/O-methyltransferase involved in polyketide biosynthesis